MELAQHQLAVLELHHVNVWGLEAALLVAGALGTPDHDVIAGVDELLRLNAE